MISHDKLIISFPIVKVVNIYRERRDHFCELLMGVVGKRVSFRVPDRGLSVWTRFIDAGSGHIAEELPVLA